MSGQDDAIADVLAGYVPIDGDNEHAAATMTAVREMLEQRTVESELLTSVEAGVIRPGDTVIFSTKGHITQAQADALKQVIRDELPGVNPIILDGLRIEGIYRDEEEA